MYCYSNFRAAINPAYIVTKSSRKELINFYKEIELNSSATPIITFGIKTLPQYYPVYVIKYSEDSLTAKVVSYYNRGTKFGGAFTKGWVYTKTLHKEPPTRK